MQYMIVTEISIILMIIIAGLLGGTINFFISSEKTIDSNNLESETYSKIKSNTTRFLAWLKCVVFGIGAAFLVPLFLVTISSSLINGLLDPVRSPKTSADTFVFFGFCLIGAISSRAFIQTLSEKVLKEVREAKIEAEQAANDVRVLKSEAEPVLLEKTEPDELSSDRCAGYSDEANLTETGMAVLKAIIHPKYVLRSKTGISRESGLDINTVREQLKILKEKALVTQVERSKGERWAITSHGQKLVNDIDLRQ